MTIHTPVVTVPRRVSDLVTLKKNGGTVDLSITFDIVPVEFFHQEHAFNAYIFMGRYSGTVDDKPFSFRKCYSRGCPHNLCPHVAQAVMIANRYLNRDLSRLSTAGIPVPAKTFTLEEMIVKFDDVSRETHSDDKEILTVQDAVAMAKKGVPVSISVDLETVSAVENFAGQSREQTYLVADFKITANRSSARLQRCLGCFQTALEKTQKPLAVETANLRLDGMYDEFDWAEIPTPRPYFH